MKISDKTHRWMIAIIATLGIFSLAFTPAWLGSLILGVVCGLLFEPWKRR